MEMLRARRGERERGAGGERERDKRWGEGQRERMEGQERGWGGQRERETENKEREDLRVFIANFPCIKGTYRESKR